jgi:ubiquinol-cytochrome c reductase iron-sulfur subunit
MSDNDDKDAPKTAAEAHGSVFDRLKHPTSTGGEPRERGTSASASEIDAEVLERGSMAPDVPAAVRPGRKIGRRQPLTDKAAAAEAAAYSIPSDDEGSHIVPPSAFGVEHDPAQVDPREERFAEWQVAALFGLTALGVIITIVGYLTINPHRHLGRTLNYVIGGGLTLALIALGAGFCLWAKKLLPHGTAVQERGPHHSPEEEELRAEETFFAGATQMGLGTRPLLRRSLLGALALLPLPALLFLRDLGPLPHSRLRHTGWRAGSKLVDVETKLPIKIGDIEIGGIATVMPEGFGSVEEHALAPTILIRFAPGEIRSKKERAWGASDHVAYSKICSHAGCPISLYEQQTHHLLCPCHQSTFDMADDANVIFGPAARRLPQLKIAVDSDGYFVAQGDYSQPVGPSFWERG